MNCFNNVVSFQGNSIDAVNAATANKCLQICKETDQCQWYSFDQASRLCILFKTCDALDKDTDFTSGEKKCDPLLIGDSKQTLLCYNFGNFLFIQFLPLAGTL